MFVISGAPFAGKMMRGERGGGAQIDDGWTKPAVTAKEGEGKEEGRNFCISLLCLLLLVWAVFTCQEIISRMGPTTKEEKIMPYRTKTSALFHFAASISVHFSPLPRLEELFLLPLRIFFFSSSKLTCKGKEETRC